MKKFVPVALLVISLAIVGLAQTSMTPGMQNAPARRSPLTDYAGAWIGTLEGHTWITVRLMRQGTGLTGTLQRPHDLNFDNSGGLKSVSEESSIDTVENAVLQGDTLLLTVKDPNTNEKFQYGLRLTSANTAELRMAAMSMPPGMAKPRPWELSRVGPSAVAPVR